MGRYLVPILNAQDIAGFGLKAHGHTDSQRQPPGFSMARVYRTRQTTMAMSVCTANLLLGPFGDGNSDNSNRLWIRKGTDKRRRQSFMGKAIHILVAFTAMVYDKTHTGVTEFCTMNRYYEKRKPHREMVEVELQCGVGGWYLKYSRVHLKRENIR
jgi:hypothetical protein